MSEKKDPDAPEAPQSKPQPPEAGKFSEEPRRVNQVNAWDVAGNLNGLAGQVATIRHQLDRMVAFCANSDLEHREKLLQGIARAQGQADGLWRNIQAASISVVGAD